MSSYTPAREATMVARELRKQINREGWDSVLFRYCVACRTKVLIDEWNKHVKTQDHLVNHLAMQEDLLRKDPNAFMTGYWPMGPEDTKWCPRCERNIRCADWYVHQEGHRTRIRRKRM